MFLENTRLAIILWVSRLLLALPTTLGLYLWFSDAVSDIPAADTLLQRIDLSVLINMVKDERTGMWTIMIAMAIVTAVVSLIVNAFLSGGVTETLLKKEESVAMNRIHTSYLGGFFSSAGYYFYRNLKLLLLSLIVAAGSVAVTLKVVNVLLKPLENSLSIAASWFFILTPITLVLLLVAFFCLFVLDYARIELVAHDTRSSLILWWRGLKMAIRFFWKTLRIWLLIGVAQLCLIAVCLGVRAAIPEFDMLLVILVFVLQQLALFVAAWLRIAGFRAEVALVNRKRKS